MTTDKYQPTITILIQALYESILNDKDVEEFTGMLRSLEAQLKAADELANHVDNSAFKSERMEHLVEKYFAAGKGE